jgi:hypothetical protein
VIVVPTQQFLWREQVHFKWDDDEIRFVLKHHAELDFYSALTHWNNSPRINMSLHSDTLFWFRANQYLLLLGEHANHYATDEPTIYHTWGDHANHYITDEPTIYPTLDEHANHYITDEPTIYHTWGEHANHYTTDEPTICHTWGEHANHYITDVV